MGTRLLKLIITVLCLTGCHNPQNKKSSEKKSIEKEDSEFTIGEYGHDIEFLKKYVNVIELINGNSRLALIPEYQGRVMTSSSSGLSGTSYGWINYDLIASGKVLDNFNPVGGEERIWLGPEGGQFSLYFENGDQFNNGKWIVPAPFDREAFEVDYSNEDSVAFSRLVELKNYSGKIFNAKVTRKVKLLNTSQINYYTGVDYDKSVEAVGYQSDNRLENTGGNVWDRRTGALSIWMLTMFNASPDVVVVLPYRKGDHGKIVKDDYLGKIPDNRLKVGNSAVFFKADAKFRSKIGISPGRAIRFIGSYDGKNNILTILEYSLPANVTEYVNSALEIQEDPFSGDVINSYNDGPKGDGTQMGRYYELETSSPAAFLKPGEEISHIQRIYHFKGKEQYLNVLSEALINVSIDEIRDAFTEI